MKELGHIARQQGDYARAVELYEAGLTLSRTAGFQSGIAEMLRSLGDVALRKGEYQKAGALVRESLALSANQGDHHNTVACLASLAELACATKEFALAARLSGVLEAHAVATGASMALGDRAAFERIVAAARSQLDEASFESAWAEGRAMPLEQAVAYALEATN